jgi:hypothetical protein
LDDASDKQLHDFISTYTDRFVNAQGEKAA